MILVLFMYGHIALGLNKVNTILPSVCNINELWSNVFLRYVPNRRVLFLLNTA